MKKGHVEAKKRRLAEASPRPTNSKIREDPKTLNRESKVEAFKVDLHEGEIQKGEMHPSTNKGTFVEAKDQDMHGPMSMKREAQSIANLINAGKAKMIRTAS